MMDCKFSDTGSAAQSDFVPGSAYSALELCLRAIKPGRLTYSQRWQFFQKKNGVLRPFLRYFFFSPLMKKMRKTGKILVLEPQNLLLNTKQKHIQYTVYLGFMSNNFSGVGIGSWPGAGIENFTSYLNSNF